MASSAKIKDHLKTLTLDDLKQKKKDFELTVKLINQELERRTGKPASTPKGGSKSTIKATKKVMESILKQHGIEYASSASKSNLEDLIRRNGLIKKTELLEAHRKVMD